MRPGILNNGYPLRTRLLFSVIRLFSRQAVPDAAKLTFYRPDFYGSHSKALTHAAMRGPSEWSVAERELMAAYISQVNDCPFCIGAHTATASLASDDSVNVTAVLADLDSTPLSEGLRATLRLLGKLTRDGHLSAAEVRAVLNTGISRTQLEDAFAICYAFNLTNRLANAFAFEQLTPEAFHSGAKYLLRRGYQ